MTVTQADVAAAVAQGRIRPRDAECWQLLTQGPTRMQIEVGQLLGGISQSQVSRKARRLERAGLLVMFRHRREPNEYRPAGG